VRRAPPAFAIVTLALLVAVTALGIDRLHDQADANRREATLFVRLDGLAGRLRLLEEQAIWSSQPVPWSDWASERAADLEAAQDEFALTLADLEQVDHDDAWRVRTAAERYVAAAAQLADLRRASNPEQAAAWDEAEVDPAFAALLALIEAETADRDAAAKRLAWLADAGTLAVLIAASVVGYVLYRQFEDDRRSTAVVESERRALARSGARLQALLANASDMVCVLDAGGAIRYASPSCERLLGYRPDELVGRRAGELARQDDAAAFGQFLGGLAKRPGTTDRVELRVHRRDGEERWLDVVATNRLADPDLRGLVVTCRDTTDRRRAEAALAGQHEALSLLAAGAPLTEVLAVLCRHLEEQLDRARCAVMLLDPASGCLRHGAGPRLPEAFVRAIDEASGLPLGPRGATGGASAPDGRPVISEDVATDPLWADFAALAATHAIRSAWSIPILDQETGAVLGTVAAYHANPRRPSAAELALVDEAVHLAGVAIRARGAEQRLRESEGRFRALVEHLPAITYIQRNDETGTTLYSSPQTEAISGWPAEVFINDSGHWLAITHPDDLGRLLEADRHANETGEPFRAEYRQRRASGTYIWIRDEAVLVEDPDGGAPYWLGVIFDVTAEKEAEGALRTSEEQFRLLFSANPYPMWVHDRETLRFLEVNDAAVAHYGYTRDEFLTMTIGDVRPAEDVARLREALVAERASLEASPGRQHRLKDGRLIDVEITSHLIAFRGRPATLVVAQDVTARKALEAELAHQALHDPLTGLANRALFLDRLGHALARIDGRGGGLAVLFLDLDDFKYVNDSLGHRAGDRLLVEVAARLLAGLRPGDTVARLGGDEFTVLLEDLAEPEEARRVAERLADGLRPPFRLDGRDVFVSASIGIAGPSAGAQADDLLRLADVAMYEAKHRGKARYAVFDVGMDDRAWKRLDLEAELRRAIATDQLRVHYQPLLDLQSGRIVEVEALVRWEHPARGLLPPGEFIPLAEETGLIVPLGRRVLEEACRQVRIWQLAYPSDPPLAVAVNLSARQLMRPELVADIAAALRGADLGPSSLTLEVTETAALHDIVAMVGPLRALRERGMRLAIDDFGTGYSGLSYLRGCPVDALKIDRAYVAGLGVDPADTAMVRAVIAFARTLGLEVVAEGVENAIQLAELVGLGCDRGQGYFFARPLPAEKLADLLSTRTPKRRRVLAAVAG
jgi:diguanylate cyclase (GGDEF)-like protein/PAS domain S-box-containing protein